MKQFVLVALTALALPACALVSGNKARDPDSPASVLAEMKHVADWQLVHPSPSIDHNKENSWTYGALYAGVMALDDIADTRVYHQAMLEVGKKFAWQPGPRVLHADDQCVSQMYLEMYLKDHDPAMLKPTQENFDYILSRGLPTNTVAFTKEGRSERWWWCDSLFMAPPVWVRLYKATGDRKYLDYMDREWWVTSSFLYNTNEHLFFRDSRYFDKREANGQPVFWGRGNGWVLAGLARVLEVMPADYPSRPRYEQQFKEMAAKIASLQQPDGLWRASLLDPASYPVKETSGSGFYTFALAWGINNGLLDRATYEPAVRKGWQALVECVTPAGKLEHVQPVGADPKKFAPTDTEVYGVGAFLLAGKEVYLLNSREQAKNAAHP